MLKCFFLFILSAQLASVVEIRRPLPNIVNHTKILHKFGYKKYIDVYFESLCPDSKRFITTQLPYVLDDFKNTIQVNLVPFGKASVNLIYIDQTLKNFVSFLVIFLSRFGTNIQINGLFSVSTAAMNALEI